MDLLQVNGDGGAASFGLSLDANSESSLPPQSFLADASLWCEGINARRTSHAESSDYAPQSSQSPTFVASGNSNDQWISVQTGHTVPTLDVLASAANSDQPYDSSIIIGQTQIDEPEREMEANNHDDSDYTYLTTLQRPPATISLPTTRRKNLSGNQRLTCTATTSASSSTYAVGRSEADRLEVARIMEQLKKGWDGTSAVSGPDDYAPASPTTVHMPMDESNCSSAASNVNYVGNHRQEGISCTFENQTLTVDLCPLFTKQLKDTIHNSRSDFRQDVDFRLRFPFETVSLSVPINNIWPKEPQPTATQPPPVENVQTPEPNKMGTTHEQPPAIKVTAVNEYTCEDGKRRWKCHLCEKDYATKFGLTSHFHLHTNARPYACDLCPKKFRQTAHLNKHKLLHAGVKFFSCRLCTKRFTQKQHLLRHTEFCRKNNVEVTSTLAYENKETISTTEHEQEAVTKAAHSTSKPPPVRSSPKKCPHCEKTVHNLQRHIQMVHETARPYICGECGSDFKHEQTWQIHMKSHRDQRPHVCEVCQASFKLLSHKQRHMLARHVGGNALKFKCETCGKCFRRKDCLVDHRRTHNVNKEDFLPCEQCGKVFRNARNFNQHKAQVHDMQDRFNCDRCKTTFTRRCNLIRHCRTTCNQDKLSSTKILLDRATDNTASALSSGESLIA